VVEALEDELVMIGMTNRARAIYIELQKLSADASEKQVAAVTKMAGEMFDLQEELRNQTDFMQNIGKRAAENILDAFADFLFDPFEEGVKGMLKGFVDAVRRMIANALAFQILSKISFLAPFLPSRASGGPVTAGQPVLVGERGPEVFIPGASGNIRSNATVTKGSGAGDPTFITNIDARGADPGLIARLPQIMEQRDRRLMIKMKTFIETGAITL